MWKHRLLETSQETLTGICKNCGPINLAKHSDGKGGFVLKCRERIKLQSKLRSRLRRRNKDPKYRGIRKKSYRKYLQKECVRCHFIPIHTCQLDVDHIDGNHKNNDPSNLQTLCANCHRLKTYAERGHNPILG